MNPKEFGWSEDQQVTVKNPTDVDFAFKVHNKDYVVPAQKTVKMPGYIAWVYVYHISVNDSQVHGDFHRWNEEGFRNTYFSKFVVGTDSLVQTVEEVEPEEDFEEVADEEEIKVAPKATAVKPMKARKRK
jgi:hypothetical protein